MPPPTTALDEAARPGWREGREGKHRTHVPTWRNIIQDVTPQRKEGNAALLPFLAEVLMIPLCCNLIPQLREHMQVVHDTTQI